MCNTIIQVNHISKQYRLGEVGTGSLSHDINRWWHNIWGKDDPYLKIGEANDRTQKANSEYVWALRDINFEVKQGEVLGIIGRNGAGKSTLLKILSRTTAPTEGNIKIKGRIASLLEVGTGFHPELTGRENIFLNGAIMGMKRTEIKYKFDEIVAFAGVEKYIDTPIKRYSTGMYVRLAFAVAAHLEPEILIVDEVLAVGDADFQKKCLGKMKDASEKEGRTVLFVSHNMAAVSKLCNRGLVMSNGQLDFVGDVQDAIRYYMKQSIVSGFQYINRKNNKTDCINEVLLIRDTKAYNQSYSFNDEIKIKLSVNHESKAPGTHIGIAILDKWHQKIFTDTKQLQQNQSTSALLVIIPARTLLTGIYYIDVALFVPNINNYDYVTDACTFEIEDFESELSIYNGVETGSVMIKCQWENIS